MRAEGDAVTVGTMFRIAICLFLLVPLALSVPPAQSMGAVIDGVLRVIDGDTVDVADTRIRLFGIDAPEGDQTCTDRSGTVLRCGDWVTAQVRDQYQGATATCAPVDTDRYGRVVARCSVAGRDMGQALVAQGLAFAYARYSRDYIATEAAALRAQRGVHGYRMDRPDQHRAAKRRPNAVPPPQTASCTIKGNISGKGVRIFHVAGQRDYAKTSIRTEKGERWFCSAAEARAAGWRAAKR